MNTRGLIIFFLVTKIDGKTYLLFLKTQFYHWDFLSVAKIQRD
jgi:hypothetical protein